MLSAQEQTARVGEKNVFAHLVAACLASAALRCREVSAVIILMRYPCGILVVIRQFVKSKKVPLYACMLRLFSSFYLHYGCST